MADEGLYKAPSTFMDTFNAMGDTFANFDKNRMLAQYAKQYPNLLANDVGISNNGLATSNLNLKNLPIEITNKNRMAQADMFAKDINNQFLPSDKIAGLYSTLHGALSPGGKMATELYGNNTLPGAPDINSLMGGIGGMMGGGAPQQSPQQMMPQQGGGLGSAPTLSSILKPGTTPPGYMPGMQNPMQNNQAPQNYPQLPMSQQQNNLPPGQQLTPGQQMLIDSQQNANSRGALNVAKLKGMAFTSMPVDQRKAVLAQAAGMGIDPNTATAMMLSGKSISDLAESQGFDPKDRSKWPSAIYPISTAAITMIQKRQQALTELNTISDWVNKSVAPYSQRFDGFSPKQIIDSFGSDPAGRERMINYVAAKGVMPELSGMRLRSMGGNIGIEAIREVQEASYGHVKDLRSQMPPADFEEAMKRMDSKITEAATAANKTGTQTPIANAVGTPSKSDSSENPNMVRVTKDGKTGNISRSKLETAQKLGYKVI